MPRFEVQIKLEQLFIMAIEADNANEAQTAAMSKLGNVTAEKTHMDVLVEKGVN